jgi:hypothetical protein
VKRAALLHDIGKIALPERCSLDTNPLPTRPAGDAHARDDGHDVLATVPQLVPAARARRRDAASGRRRRLSRRPAGRHDSWSRASSRWPMRRLDGVERAFNDPKSHDEATSGAGRGSGSQFDPRVVRVWMREAEAARC